MFDPRPYRGVVGLEHGARDADGRPVVTLTLSCGHELTVAPAVARRPYSRRRCPHCPFSGPAPRAGAS